VRRCRREEGRLHCNVQTDLFFALRAQCAPPRPAPAGSRRVGGRFCSPTISPFAIDLPAPFAARLDARALRRSCARTLKLSSGQLVPAQHGSMARSARACCAGAAAKAPTQRAARRNRRRMWCLGLRLDAHGGAGGGSGGGDGSHHLCSTPSSCDDVERVFAFPTGERARRCTQVRCRRRLQRRPDGHGGKEASAHCKAMWDGVREEPGKATMARLSPRAAPRHLVSTRRASPSSPPRLVRVRNPQRRLPRTDVGAAAACAAGLRPPPIRPTAWEASVGGVRGFHRVRVLVFV
jgi:hypothetical protein